MDVLYTNVVTNPSVEVVGSDSVSRVNMFTNPQAVATFGGFGTFLSEDFETEPFVFTEGDTFFFHQTVEGRTGNGLFEDAGNSHRTIYAPNTFNSGVRISSWVYMLPVTATNPTGPLTGVAFGYNPQANTGYQVHIDGRNGTGSTSSFQIRKNGTPIASSGSIGVLRESWYRIEADWLPGGIQARLYDNSGTLIHTLNSNDIQYQSGYIGPYGYNSGRWDDFTVTGIIPLTPYEFRADPAQLSIEQSSGTDFGATNAAKFTRLTTAGASARFTNPANPNTNYYVSFDVRLSDTRDVTIYYRPNVTSATNQVQLFSGPITGNEIHHLSYSFNTGPGTVSPGSSGIAIFSPSGSVGEIWEITNVYFSVYSGPFFDGSMAPQNDATYSWQGVANRSASQEVVKKPNGWTLFPPVGFAPRSSTEWSKSGSRSVRLIGVDNQPYSAAGFPVTNPEDGIWTAVATVRLEAPQSGPYSSSYGPRSLVLAADNGPTDTFVSAPNLAGEFELRASLNVSNASVLSVLVFNTAGADDEDVWFDDVALISPTGMVYYGPYFDGNTQDTPNRVYAWTGAENASTSTASTYSGIPEGENAVTVNNRYVWFGNTQKMQWLPMPSSGMQVRSNVVSEVDILENGGSSGFTSAGYHRSYDFDFGIREASGAQGLDMYHRYATGYYNKITRTSGERGTLLNLFADPSLFDQNILPPHWASPLLAINNNTWHHIGEYVDWVETAANTHDQPSVSLIYSVDQNSGINYPFSPRKSVYLAIPPTHRFSFGWSGESSDAGAGFGYTTWKDGVMTESSVVVPPLDPAGNQRIGSLEVSGQDADVIQIYQVGSAPGQTITVASMMAQLIPLSEATDATGGMGGKHIFGLGNSGCIFDGEARTESYIQMETGKHYKGLSFTLTEVGSWGAEL